MHVGRHRGVFNALRQLNKLVLLLAAIAAAAAPPRAAAREERAACGSKRLSGFLQQTVKIVARVTSNTFLTQGTVLESSRATPQTARTCPSGIPYDVSYTPLAMPQAAWRRQERGLL